MTRRDDFAYASGYPRICVPPAGRAFVRDGIAITIKHNVSPLDEQIYSVHILGIKRAKSDPLSVGFTVAQRAFFKLDYGNQELFAIVGRDDLGITVEPPKASGP
jgi:hypothetical protein